VSPDYFLTIGGELKVTGDLKNILDASAMLSYDESETGQDDNEQAGFVAQIELRKAMMSVLRVPIPGEYKVH